MRITRESLIRLAKEQAASAAKARRSLVSVYLTGSLLREEPLLGGTTDIDLVYIHAGEPPVAREVIRLSPEVSFDIAHHNQAEYRNPRHLRLNPWLGPAIYATRLVLHDTQHFFEFTQASVASQFYRPENVSARARSLYDQARQGWLKAQSAGLSPLEHAAACLEAAAAGANTIASLNGELLTERRILLDFPGRAKAAGKAGLAAGLVGLLGLDPMDGDTLRAWLADWRALWPAVDAQPGLPVRFHPARRFYYEKAIDALISGEHLPAAGWLLFNTWTSLAACLPAADPLGEAWLAAAAHLKLDLSHGEEKSAALDAYLDGIEETLEAWERTNGVWSSAEGS